MSANRRIVAASAVAALLASVLVACSPAESPSQTSEPSPTNAEPSAPPTTSAPLESIPVVEVATREEIVGGLDVPWDLEFLADGTMLVSERNSGRIWFVAGGVPTEFGGAGADDLRSMLAADGEAGLLGMAGSPTQPGVLYVYITRTDGNAVVSLTTDGGSGRPLLGPAKDVVAGLPHAENHDGGRIAFGPDGYLYIATGDAAQPGLAQDPDSEAGKILRVIADGSASEGEPAPGNPFGTRVWSMGHRNVEGIAWAPDGRMFASEFGQDALDELNLIVSGRNYGWPQVEGTNGAPSDVSPEALLGTELDGFTYPVTQWPTSEASPSGIAITDEGIYIAALRGERVWRVPLTADGVGTPHVLLDDVGRVRDIEVGPDGAIYVVTGNTDGRGEFRDGDDRILRITVAAP